MTFEVSSCAKFQIFRGSAPDPTAGASGADPLQELTMPPLPDLLPGGQSGGRSQEPHSVLSALGAEGLSPPCNLHPHLCRVAGNIV